MTEIEEVDDDVQEVSCDGGRQFGHPLVYLTLGDDRVVECYYCGKRFQHKHAQGQSGESATA